MRDLDRSASLRPLFTLLFWTHVGTGAVTRFVSCLSSRPPTYVARAGAWLSCPGPSTDPISGQGGGGSRPVVRSFGPQQALLEASRASGSHPRTHAFGSAPPLRKGCATGRAVRTALWDALWARPRRFTRPHSPFACVPPQFGRTSFPASCARVMAPEGGQHPHASAVCVGAPPSLDPPAHNRCLSRGPVSLTALSALFVLPPSQRPGYDARPWRQRHTPSPSPTSSQRSRWRTPPSACTALSSLRFPPALQLGGVVQSPCCARDLGVVAGTWRSGTRARHGPAASPALSL